MSANSNRQSFAACANLAAIFCASVSFLAMAVSLGQIFTGHHPRISAFAVMVSTLPVTIICTIISLALVGVRQSKLALAAIGVFMLQFGLGYIAQIVLTHP